MAPEGRTSSQSSKVVVGSSANEAPAQMARLLGNPETIESVEPQQVLLSADLLGNLPPQESPDSQVTRAGSATCGTDRTFVVQAFGRHSLS